MSQRQISYLRNNFAFCDVCVVISDHNTASIFCMIIPYGSIFHHHLFIHIFLHSIILYSVFHQFRQAKFDNGGSILRSSQLATATAPSASKYKVCFKSGQNRLKNIYLAKKRSKSVKLLSQYHYLYLNRD
jgi:hypothetical protein